MAMRRTSAIYAQRYNASGVAQGGEFRINSTTADDQRYSRVAMDAAGNFTVTWMSFGQDGDSTAESNIYAREYDAAGTALGSAFRVNTTTSTNQQFSAVTRTAAGDYIIVWSGNGTGDATGVFGQRYYVNKPPVVNATASDTGTEDTDVVYTHAQLLTLIGATDVDDANANLSIVISNINNGTLVMSGGSGGAGTTFTFTPTANFTGNLTFDYQVSDDESPTQNNLGGGYGHGGTLGGQRCSCCARGPHRACVRWRG